jgi:exosortase B
MNASIPTTQISLLDMIGSVLVTMRRFVAAWWPVLLGLLILYFPTFRDLAAGAWTTEDQAHGPIILLVVGYLFWMQGETVVNAPPSGKPLLGWLVFVFGLLLFAIGRSQEILVFEIGSLVPVLTGVMLVNWGWYGIRTFWFPIMFTVFLIPLPGLIVDAATGPLKAHISSIAENTLYMAGYPIARDGVTIVIGPYQLLVADACSGLHSMFSLSALGLLYLQLMQYRNPWRNAVIVASILPIAFAANVVRVIVLILVTYHYGDEAGQGFIHGSAGIMLFVISLFFLFFLDTILGKLRVFRDAPAAVSPSTVSGS